MNVYALAAFVVSLAEWALAAPTLGRVCADRGRPDVTLIDAHGPDAPHWDLPQSRVNIRSGVVSVSRLTPAGEHS